MKITGKSIWVGTGFLVSGICLWLFLRDIEWNNVKIALREVKYFYVLPTMLGFILIYVLRVIRWWSLFSEIKNVSFLNVSSATAIGFMANNLLPARAGEIIKTVFLGKKEDIGIATVLATVIMERLLDTMSLIVLAIVTFALVPALHQGGVHNPISENPMEIQDTHFILQLKSGVGILSALCVLSLFFFIFLDLYSRQALDTIGRLLYFLPHNFKEKIIKILESFILGLKVLKSIKQVVWLAALSFGNWFLFIASAYILGYSFGIDIPFTGMCLVAVCTGLAVVIPQAPGYIGVFHLAVLKALELFHIELSVAQSFAIVLWTVNLFVTLIIGLFFLWREGVTFEQIMRRPSSPSEIEFYKP